MVIENLIINRCINNVEMRYSYKLTECNFNNVQAYGIAIERMDYKNCIKVNSLVEEVKLISPNKEKVKNLLYTLYNAEVSPLHLIDIIGECVDESVNDFKDIECRVMN